MRKYKIKMRVTPKNPNSSASAAKIKSALETGKK